MLIHITQSINSILYILFYNLISIPVLPCITAMEKNQEETGCGMPIYINTTQLHYTKPKTKQQFSYPCLKKNN